MNFLKLLKRYWKAWLILSQESLLVNFSRKFGFFIFLTGKILRFLFFFAFLLPILGKTGGLASYNGNQVVFFFLTFYFVSSLSQTLFRSVYTFRPQVVSGNFDLILSKPLNPLFRVVLGGMDPIDLVTIPPLLVILILAALNFNPDLGNVFSFIVLIFNAFLVSFALHTLIAAFGVMTLEIDQLVMIYRDVETMARFPLEIYGKNLSFFLTYIIPLGIMIAFPAKALMGLLSWRYLLLALVLGLIFLISSVKFWHFALKRYTSASS